MGSLQAKSMTSQRAANKMTDMRYYDVMTTTRWGLYVTMETLRQQQDGGYAYHVINSTSSTVQSWTELVIFFESHTRIAFRNPSVNTALVRASTKTFVSRVRKTAKKIFVSRKIR